LVNRFIIFLKFIREIKNWYLIFLIYFGFLNGNFTLRLKNKLCIKIRATSTDIQALANVFILEEYGRTGFEIKNNDVVIDVGGHIGLFSLYASQYCKIGTIFCFEPIKDNFDLLVSNIQINNLSNIHYFNKAIFNENKPTRIYLNSSDQAAHSIFGHGNNFVDIDTTTLSEVMDSNRIKMCNLLKLDCEGSEYEILQSTPDDYFNRIQKICLEYHILENNFEPLNLLKSRLTSLGYKVFDMPQKDNLGMLFAKK